MAEFMLLTRVYENQRTGENERGHVVVNLDHVRLFRPKQAFPDVVRRGGTWIVWNAPDVPDTEIAETFGIIAEQLGIWEEQLL